MLSRDTDTVLSHDTDTVLSRDTDTVFSRDTDTVMIPSFQTGRSGQTVDPDQTASV